MLLKKGSKLPTPLLLPHLSALEPYPPGKPIEEVEREYGLDEVVKLASNENPLGPSPRAVKAMIAAAKEMNLYPDGGGFYLRREIARRLGVEPEEIILGAGSDEITSFLALCYLAPGRSIVTSEYSFIRYRMAATQTGARAKIVAMKNFRHDPKALAAAVDDTTVILFVDNPVNPTGTMMTKREINALLKAVPSRVLVVIDEAYYEFARGDADYPDTLALRMRYPNLIITRTFSKAYGLAGVRIGYAIARPEVVNDLDRVRSPFNASRIAQVAATAALGDLAHIKRSVANNEKGKRYLEAALKKLGLKTVPTWANFILVDFSTTGLSGGEVYQALLQMGVIIRPMAGYGLPGYARISIGTPRENKLLVQAVRTVL